jgi:tetratricopeptide (TPR) repeat protein
MTRKKESTTLLSEQDSQQVQHLLAQYHQLAEALHNSPDQTQAEAVLSTITSLPEAAQLAVLKALAKEKTGDAADVLAAINTLSPDKEMRKEARRSLIRLEATKTYPQWTAPITHLPAVQMKTAHPPRFWKGVVTQAREQGEVQLLLLWEQGFDYSEARIISFLLDYWHDGVKDIFIEIGSKRQANEHINSLRNKLEDTSLTDCTLAEGKRLIEEALAINNWRGTMPHKDHRLNQSLINNLILQASDLGEDRGYNFINPELTDQEMVINFIGAWSMGDYGLAYDLLSNDSSISEGLSGNEWSERHRQWADEAHPARLELGFIRERQPRQSMLWLPTSAISHAPSRKEVEIGWSLELTETPLSGTLRAMPMGTAVNKESRRHWFWTSYTLVKELNGWRIQGFVDEGARVQGLPIAELQQHIKELEEAIQQKLQQDNKNFQEFVKELPWRFTQVLHYYDALIARLPLDRQICDGAYNHAVTIDNPERIMVYLERLAQRFPEERGNVLRNLATTQMAYAYSDRTQQIPKQSQHFLSLAEKTLYEAMELDNSPMNYILLADLHLNMQHHDVAEATLLKARELPLNPLEEVAIELGLGNITMQCERFSEAISHFQRATDLKPEIGDAWLSLGLAHRLLGNLDEAEPNYRRALQIEPDNISIYLELVALYMKRSDKQEARRIAEQGVLTNPTSAHLHALYASVLLDLGDLRGAQRQLEDAEAINPDLEIVQQVREHIHMHKKR